MSDPLVLKIQTLQARIEEMHDENSLVYEKLEQAIDMLKSCTYSATGQLRGKEFDLLTEAMGILHGYTNPKLTPPQEGN